jgi:plasmid stabilization system protein ParE
MRVRYSLRAFSDREAIYEYLEKRSAQGAQNVKIAIAHAIRSLASHPRLGRLIVPRLPYKVYYRLEHEEVGFCTSVTHGAVLGKGKATRPTHRGICTKRSRSRTPSPGAVPERRGAASRPAPSAAATTSRPTRLGAEGPAGEGVGRPARPTPPRCACIAQPS